MGSMGSTWPGPLDSCAWAASREAGVRGFVELERSSIGFIGSKSEVGGRCIGMGKESTSLSSLKANSKLSGT